MTSISLNQQQQKQFIACDGCATEDKEFMVGVWCNKILEKRVL